MYIQYYNANGLIETLGDIRHYNHNHDALGRFARSRNSFSRSSKYEEGLPEAMAYYGRYRRRNASSKEMYKAGKKLYKDYLHSNEESNGFKPKRITENRKLVAAETRDALSNDAKYKEAKKNLSKANDQFEKALERYNKALYESGSVDEAINSKKFLKAESDYHKSEKLLDKSTDKYIKERNRVADKFLSRYADATINDLQITNNDEVRDYIIRNNVDNWFDEHMPGSYSSFLYDKTDRQKEKYNRTHRR